MTDLVQLMNESHLHQTLRLNPAIFRSNDRAILANRVVKTSGHFQHILHSQRTERD